MWTRVAGTVQLLSLASPLGALQLEADGDGTRIVLDGLSLSTRALQWEGRGAEWKHVGARVRDDALTLFVDGEVVWDTEITRPLVARLRQACQLLAATDGEAWVDEFGWWQVAVDDGLFAQAMQHGVLAVRQAGSCACDGGQPGRTGQLCNRCAPGFFGDDCSACSAACGVKGACGGAAKGGDACSCAAGWAGAACDEGEDDSRSSAGLVAVQGGLLSFGSTGDDLFTVIAVLVLLGVGVLDVLLAKQKPKGGKKEMKKGQTKKKAMRVRRGKLFGAALALFDIITDVMFTAKLAQRAATAGTALYWSSVMSIAVPAVVNCVLVSRFLTIQLRAIAFRKWMRRHLNFAVAVAVLSFVNPNVLGVLTAGHGGIAALCAPLSRRTQDEVTVMAVTNNMLEDLPQAIVRVVFLQTALATGLGVSAVDIAGLLTSGLMLLYGLFRRGMLAVMLKLGREEEEEEEKAGRKEAKTDLPAALRRLATGEVIAAAMESGDGTTVVNPLVGVELPAVGGTSEREAVEEVEEVKAGVKGEEG
eukprot:PLAT11657.10.p1 GENE.PLAT11657.10~~PLAT11657.10.p1  ORF type:complete len:532 (+),score=177.34 PLAT11657.10:728-2323(+)